MPKVVLIFDRVVDWQTKLNTLDNIRCFPQAGKTERIAHSGTYTPKTGKRTAEDGGSEDVEVRLEVSNYSVVHVRILQHS